MTGRRNNRRSTASTAHKETETMRAKRTLGRKLTGALAALAAALGMSAIAGPAQALAAPVLDVSMSHVLKTGVPAGTYAKYEIVVSNTGDAFTGGVIDVEFTLPAGLKVTAATDEITDLFGFPFPISWDCTIAGDAQSVSCSGIDPLGFFGGPLPIFPGQEACVGIFPISCRILITVKADPGAPAGTLTPTVEACGGGAAACANDSDPTEIIPFDFSLASVDALVLDALGEPATQAGSHPHLGSTGYFLSTFLAANGWELANEELQDTAVELPAGLVANPQALPTCTQAQLSFNTSCPPESQVGTAKLGFNGPFNLPPLGTYGTPAIMPVPLYNMERPSGTAAVPIGTPGLLAFNVAGTVIQVYTKLRTGGDYGITVLAKNSPQTLPVAGINFDIWGVPADPAHDAERKFAGEFKFNAPSSAPLRPFLTLPTSCTGPVETRFTVTGWKGSEASASSLSHDNTEPVPNPIGADGCNAVPFAPAIEARPSTNLADSPAGLDVDVEIPQSEDPVGIATAHLKDVTITLPEGLTINPSGANGLGGCSPAEADLKGTGAAKCPDASRLGSAAAESPLLDHPLRGSVYLADPFDNPFNSLLAIYLALDDPQTGIVVKLAGELSADPGTGRLSATFEQNPQLPFEHLKMNFFGGAGAVLKTPATCGEYTTTSSLTPYSAPDSGPPKTPSDTWAIEAAPGGGSCATTAGAQPHAPSFDAGTVSPIAGAHSPLVVHLRRSDGSQTFSAVTLSTPPGLLAKLAGTESCTDAALAAAAAKTGAAEQASPSCPAASDLGSVVVGAGAGPAPYNAAGRAYLAGPYKGAPLSLAIIVPAVAGPFDLGTVVTRVAAHIDSKTAQLTAITDPLPRILEGIPLNVRTVDISLDRPEFTKNPTSCDPMAFDGLLTSTLGQTAALQSRFQVGECGRLGFKPKVFLRLDGKRFGRGANPRLRAVVMPRAGDANIARAAVKMPSSLFLDQSHIRTVCTRVQFAADACPASSVYGHASAQSPLLDYPLTGNVYLRSSDNKLPDLVADLRGPAHQPVKFEVVGRTDSVKGALRNTFEMVPDVPVSKFVLSLQGGRKSLLVASRNLCKGTQRARVNMAAHNAARQLRRPRINIPRCRKAQRAAKRRAAKRRAAAKRVALSAARRSG